MAKLDENNISDEDYLDSLLNSVVNNEPEQNIQDDFEQVHIDEDIGEILDEDIFNFDDISFDDLLEQSLQNELDSLEFEEGAASSALSDVTEKKVVDEDEIISEIPIDQEDVASEYQEEQDESENDEDMQELFAMLNSDFDAIEEPAYPEPEPVQEESEEKEEIDEDFADLLNSIAMGEDVPEENNEEKNEEAVEESIDALSLFDAIGSEESTESTESTESAGDLDAFGDMDDLSKMLDELSNLANEEESTLDIASKEEIDIEEKENKKGLFSKIFGKKEKKEKKEKSNEETGQDDSQMISFDEFDLSDIEDRTEENEKEKAKKEKAEEKAKKAQEKKEKKEQSKAERAEKAKKKKAEKEKRVKPPAEIINIPVPVYILIVTFVAGVGLLVFSGSKFISYNSDMKAATKSFVKDDYSKAYDYLAGMDIKSSDKDFYDQVITIMYVEKQYLSYNNYRKIEDYERALHSLIKGIEKYDKHKATAKELNVLDDIEVSYGRIIKALKYDFSLSEQDAKAIAEILNEEEYSAEIREVVENSLSKIEENISKENKKKTDK